VALAQNDHLVDAYRRVSIPGFMLEAMPRPESIEGMLADHAQLVDAYRRRDLEGIMSISRQHADRAKTVHQNAIASRIHPVGDGAPSC
jgi:DNA-binding GntR family transcriptional regulator